MNKATVGELKRFLSAYPGKDSDLVFGIITTNEDNMNPILSKHFADNIIPYLHLLRLGVLGAASVPETPEDTEAALNRTFFLTHL